MPEDLQFRRKLSEKEITALSEGDLRKLERVNQALAQSEQAEANKESQLKMRILFERTAPEMLPFIVYCLTFAPVAAYALFKIVDLKDNPAFYWALGGLLVIMILPLFILPQIPFKRWLSKET